MTIDAPRPKPLSVLFDPRSIAIIGASDGPARIGGRPLLYMKDGTFDGPVYPVNANRDRVQGHRAWRSIREVPGPVDCAIIAVPAPAVVQAVRDCAAKGVGGCVIFSSGFAEAGEDQGREWQEELNAIARATGIRLLGPNCLGVFNAKTGWRGTFSTSVERFRPTPGPIGIASQSGAYGGHVYTLTQTRGIKTTYWITTGNECDVTVAECVEFLAASEETRVICAYAEGVRDGPRLRRALALAQAKQKPVIFMKVGKTEVGAAAAASHTASLAGSDAVIDALFRQYGVFRAESTDEILDICYACQPGIFPQGKRTGLLTISGGVGVQMADAAAERGLDVAPMPEAAQQEIRRRLPFAAVRNPVDITAQAFNDMSLVTLMMRLMLEQGRYDALVAFFTLVASAPAIADDLIRRLEDARKASPDALIFMSIIASPEICRLYEENGYLVYEDQVRALHAAAAVMHFGSFFARGAGAPPPAARPGALPAPAGAVAEHEATSILASAGIPVACQILAASPAAAVAAWREIGGPVVLKIASSDITHKTEIGGVLLGLDDADAVAEGYATLLARAGEHRPDARIDGVIVAEMVTGGVETVLGVTRDPTFGPAVMFGLGGILVEVLGDVTFRLAPFGIDEAHRMIREIRGFPVLEGVRGAPPADIDALAEALARLSVFAADNAGRIDSIDVNPFIVLPRGQGAKAVDALIVPASD